MMGVILVMSETSMFACGTSLEKMILEADIIVSKVHHQLFLVNL
jgi:hypothetical protein